jgi:spoIIIJ-associated protein
MEWVETTAKTIEEAKELALDQLGVGDEDAEFEVLEEPRAGLFGLLRGEARVRARVRPTEVRPKYDRRRGRRGDRAGDAAGAASTSPEAPTAAEPAPSGASSSGTAASSSAESSVAPGEPNGRSRGRRGGTRRDEPAASGSDGRDGGDGDRGPERGDGDGDGAGVEPAVVGDAAATFVRGLVDSFGLEATTDVRTEDSDIEVTVSGEQLGLLIGPGGRTLLAIQDLARVAAQRRLGDHDTRLRVDVAGYRERRRVALERFATQVADQVRETGVARALEPMPSADRKVVHDTIASLTGVSSRSDGEDPQRRVVVVPDE